MSFDITYYSFSPGRAEEVWKTHGEDKIKELGELYKDIDLSDPVRAEEVISEIKIVDLAFGGIKNLVFPGAVIVEESKSLIIFISSIHQVYNLEQESETITKENLIHIFRNLSPEKVNEASHLCVDECGFDFDDAKQAITSFLTEMKPLVKDLISTADSVLYVDYHGSVDGEPIEVEELLNNRAKNLFEKYAKHFSK